MRALKSLSSFLTPDGESRSVKVAPSIPEELSIQRQSRCHRFYMCQWRVMLLLHRTCSVPCGKMITLPLCLSGSSFNLNYLAFFPCLMSLSAFINQPWVILNLKNLGLSDIRNAKQVDRELTCIEILRVCGIFTALIWPVSDHFTCVPHVQEIFKCHWNTPLCLTLFYPIYKMEVRFGHLHSKLPDLQIRKRYKSLGHCRY